MGLLISEVQMVWLLKKIRKALESVYPSIHLSFHIALSLDQTELYSHSSIWGIVLLSALPALCSITDLFPKRLHSHIHVILCYSALVLRNYTPLCDTCSSVLPGVMQPKEVHKPPNLLSTQMNGLQIMDDLLFSNLMHSVPGSKILSVHFWIFKRGGNTNSYDFRVLCSTLTG